MNEMKEQIKYYIRFHKLLRHSHDSTNKLFGHHVYVYMNEFMHIFFYSPNTLYYFISSERKLKANAMEKWIAIRAYRIAKYMKYFPKFIHSSRWAKTLYVESASMFAPVRNDPKQENRRRRACTTESNRSIKYATQCIVLSSKYVICVFESFARLW